MELRTLGIGTIVISICLQVGSLMNESLFGIRSPDYHFLVSSLLFWFGVLLVYITIQKRFKCSGGALKQV